MKVLKSFPFKGGSRVWSNRYYFNGGTPADDTHWHLLMDSIVSVEETLYSSDTTIIECIGYAAGSDVPVSSKLYAATGSLTPGSGVAKAPGEVAALVRWQTSARTSKNHPIYLFKYFHDVFIDTAAAGQDTLSPNQHTVMTTYANQWVSGYSDGVNTYVLASPHGALGHSPTVETYVTHRDFPYTRSA